MGFANISVLMVKATYLHMVVYVGADLLPVDNYLIIIIPCRHLSLKYLSYVCQQWSLSYSYIQTLIPFKLIFGFLKCFRVEEYMLLFCIVNCNIYWNKSKPLKKKSAMVIVLAFIFDVWYGASMCFNYNILTKNFQKEICSSKASFLIIFTRVCLYLTYFD